MSTSTLGGHVNTIPKQPPADGQQRRRRRLHSAEFKASAVASCMQPGMSMSAVAMTHGVNANLLRRWVREAELHPGAERADTRAMARAPSGASAAAFVPMQLPAPVALNDIRIELRRGSTLIAVTWPTDAAAECAAWMRELLR